MGAIVTFNPEIWQAQFPELANVTPAQASAYFSIATTFQRNDGGGPINDASVQANGLNLLVSHIAVLSGWQPNAQGGVFDGSTARIVGHIDSATEGSVTVQTTFDTGTASSSAMKAWAIQTTYGATWWAMTGFSRTFHYVRTRPYVPNPWPFG